jgi:glycosyltransferase involved in cell wall biosynthesis
LATAPLVSIITATYNRANILRYSIQSVLAQTLTDWELLVAGDACTDETEETVLEFQDPRIRFFNLPCNAGDQSGPNNQAFRRARGRYIAYLSHDDLWFPDHLATSIAMLEETGADLVWPLIVKRRTDGVFVCDDLSDQRRYEPHIVVPASFWVLRREVVEAVGPWRHHTECHAAPSQDWLYRAYRAGKDLRYIPRFTVLALPSGGRPGAYARREFAENAAVWEQMRRDPEFRQKILVGVAEYFSMKQTSAPVWESVRNTFRDVVRRLLARYWGWPNGQYTPAAWIACKKRLLRLVGRAGFHPMSVEFRLKYRRQGEFIRYLRRLRGLPADAGESAVPRAGE